MSTSEQIRPARLRAGARVALVAPAGPLTEEKIERALARCAELELEPLLGRSARARTAYLAGPDEERAADLRAAIEDESIDVIWALRGGYGVMRIMPSLDLAPLLARPRPLIGFSDITALHLALTRAGLVSFHGPHPTSDLTPLTDACFRRVLFHAEPAGVLPLPVAGGAAEAEAEGGDEPAGDGTAQAAAEEAGDPDASPVTLLQGVAEGPLVGGNLSMVAATCGTPAAMTAEGKIVFLEEVGEAGYRVDRMLAQLRLAGALDGAVGLAFGRFSEVPPYAYDRPMPEVLGEYAQALGVPAVMGLPIGHVPDNWTLPLGVRARLDASAGTLALLEPAVA